jgi:ribonuclease G
LKKEILVNSTDFETRIGLLEDGLLVELMSVRRDEQRIVGNIYKGVIKTVLPGMQAAFIDIGLEGKAAYLHSSDIGKRYERDEDDDEVEAPAEIVRKHRRAGIETVLKRNQEILVQVIKEAISTKGPRIATEISLPGRFVVIVPNDDHIRVSKRISNWGERRRLRKIIQDMRPEGFGVIVRTEGEGKSENEFKTDIKRLMRFWTKLKRKADSAPAPLLIHQEEEMIVSMIRDVFTTDVEKLVCDNKEDYKKIMSYARQVAPEMRKRIHLYKGDLPLFDQYNIEQEIDKMLDRKVWIRKGAYLVIDQTEAMVTIDVNTGRFVGGRDQENTILQVNLEAAREAARQIRLRDIGGLIICDFIDMYSRDNRRRLFEHYQACFKHDRAKRAINPVTEFGLIEMTRERVRMSHMHHLSEPCHYCQGLGRVASKENMATKIERWFQRAKAEGKLKAFHLAVNPLLAETMSNNGTNRIDRLMKSYRFKINLVRDTTIPIQEYKIYNADSNEEITEKYKAT